LSVLRSFKYIKGEICNIASKKLLDVLSMKNFSKEGRNGYAFASKSVKQHIEDNEFIKEIRRKLLEERMKKTFSK
jgi:hypothetical protein